MTKESRLKSIGFRQEDLCLYQKGKDITMVQPMIGLREIRRRKGYSQLKVAMDLSISREALSYYETGKRSPDVHMLLLLSSYFDVSIHYLITGKEFVPRNPIPVSRG